MTARIYMVRLKREKIWDPYRMNGLETASIIFTREKRLSARLSHRNSVRLSVRPSVRPFVTRVDQSKTVQARITKSLPSAVWKILVSGTVKLFHKLEKGHPERGR